MHIDERTESIVLRICEAPSLLDSMLLFCEYRDMLKGYKFIFASKSGTQMGYSINKKFSNGGVIRNLFDSDHVCVLDETTVDEMTKNGASHFPIDYSISLDTMSFSYLEPYFKGKHKTLPGDFKEVFDFISNDNVNVNSLLYQIENSANLQSDYNLKRIYEKIKAYELLRNFNSNLYLKKGVISSTITEQELEVKAQKFMSGLLYNNKNKSYQVKNDNIFNCVFLYLLEMLLIQKNMKHASLEKKLLALMHFSHYDMSFFSFREMLIAKRYFENDDKFQFFNKIKPNNKKLLNTIKGMSWDLCHIRNLERFLTVNGENKARYFFPAILTFDKGFIDLLEMNSLKSIAINKELNQIQPFYKLDFYQEYSAVSELVKDKLHYYFAYEIRKQRISKIENDRLYAVHL